MVSCEHHIITRPYQNVTIQFTSRRPMLASAKILFYSLPDAETMITGSEFRPCALI